MPATNLIIRLSQEDKDRIRQAAERSGASMTTFVLRVSRRAARRVLAAKKPKPVAKDDLLDVFKALCLEAGRGGANGYRRAGRAFAKVLARQRASERRYGYWEGRVPWRRRKQFRDGMYEPT